MIAMDKKRFLQIDVLRAIAIICVIICHSTESVYSFEPNVVSSHSLKSMIFQFSSITVGRIGVPIFLLITGYLLLDKYYDSVAIRRFYVKNWLGLLLTTEIWIVIYNIFLTVYLKIPFVLSDFIYQLLLVKNVNLCHMWYMPMILGIYLFIPLVANALHSTKSGYLKLPLIIYTSFAFVFPVVNKILTISNESLYAVSSFDLGFSGGVYGLYLLFGYFLKNNALKKIKIGFLFLSAIISFASIVSLQIYTYHTGNRYNLWYDNIFILICSVSVFELITRIKKIRFSGMWYIISKYSFAVFLIHKLLLIIAVNNGIYTFASNPVQILLLTVCTLIICLAVIHLINQIPKLGKYLFYINN